MGMACQKAADMWTWRIDRTQCILNKASDTVRQVLRILYVDMFYMTTIIQKLTPFGTFCPVLCIDCIDYFEFSGSAYQETPL